MVLTAAGIVLSLFSASATLLEISPAHNFADEQEISATVAPEPTENPLARERTVDPGVASVDDENPTGSGVSPVEGENPQAGLGVSPVEGENPRAGLGVSPVDDENPPGIHPCHGGELISFEGLPHGTILAEQYSARGVHISAEAPDGRPDAVVVFDSGASGTSDPNLEIGIGNLAVIAEDVPGNGYGGGTQVYTFDRDREVLYVVFVDVDTLSLQEVKTFDADGAEIATVPILAGGDSSVQTLELGTQGVRRLEITYRDSGALAEICLDARH